MTCFKLLVTVALVALCHDGYKTNAYEIPEECKDKALCEVKPSFYNGLQGDINDKFLPIQKKFNLTNDDDELSDWREIADSELNCLSETKVIKPYIVSTNGTGMAVVQTDFYEQKFKTTECVSWEDYSLPGGDECFLEMTTGTSRGYCKTKYTTILVYVYNKENDRIQRVFIELPVFCSCVITS